MELACVRLISMTASTAAMWASRDSAAREACELDLLVFEWYLVAWRLAGLMASCNDSFQSDGAQEQKHITAERI